MHLFEDISRRAHLLASNHPDGPQASYDQIGHESQRHENDDPAQHHFDHFFRRLLFIIPVAKSECITEVPCKVNSTSAMGADIFHTTGLGNFRREKDVVFTGRLTSPTRGWPPGSTRRFDDVGVQGDIPPIAFTGDIGPVTPELEGRDLSPLLHCQHTGIEKPSFR